MSQIPDSPNPSADDGVLRAKYIEYCSAQLADLLLYLSADEIFVLAQKAARASGETGDVSYMKTVEVATNWLAQRVSLPTFEVWVRDYRANPERYDSDLMGLWQAGMEVGTDG